MTAGTFGRLPRIALLACAAVLFTATITFAASSTLTAPAAPAVPAAAPEPEALVVPDVRKQAYVFAKGSLEQEGFAWRVEGAVPGYAANLVVSQSPAPGSKIVPDGAPVIVLRLAKNPAYKQEGVPENQSPYAGKPAKLVGAAVRKPAQAPAKAAASAPAAKPAKPTGKPAAKPAGKRAPAFTVSGAPAEPLDEVTLDVRAKQLAAWLEKHPERTPENVNLSLIHI